MICEINGQEVQKVFLPNWQYNVVRLQNELRSIVEAAGGECVIANSYKGEPAAPVRPTYVVNRTIMSDIKELEDFLSKVRSNIDMSNISIDSLNIYWSYEKRLEYLKSIPNEPILKTGAKEFIYNGMFYGILFDSNLFMDTHYLVAEVVDGDPSYVMYSCYNVLGDDGWKYDCLYTPDCSDSDIHEVAMKLWSILQSRKPTQNKKIHLYLHPIKK